MSASKAKTPPVASGKNAITSFFKRTPSSTEPPVEKTAPVSPADVATTLFKSPVAAPPSTEKAAPSDTSAAMPPATRLVMEDTAMESKPAVAKALVAPSHSSDDEDLPISAIIQRRKPAASPASSQTQAASSKHSTLGSTSSQLSSKQSPAVVSPSTKSPVTGKKTAAKTASKAPAAKRPKVTKASSDDEGDEEASADDASEYSGSGDDSSSDGFASAIDDDDDADSFLAGDDEGYSAKKGAKGAKGAAKVPRAKGKSSPMTKSAKSITTPTSGAKRKRDEADDDQDGEGLNIDDDATGQRSGVLPAGQHKHNFWKWLTADRRDGKQRRPTDPDYNPRTLYVPPDFVKSQTPASQQWWGFKAANFDTVLFFKQGKFYETFHMDADVCVRELGLIYMKGEQAHAGFPEISYGYFSEKLVAAGYRVARVEQTETPQQMKARHTWQSDDGALHFTPNGVAAQHNTNILLQDRNATKKGPKDKVVMRELCGIKSKGTRTYNHLDVFAGASAAADQATSPISGTVDGVYMDVSIGESRQGTGNFSSGGGNFLYVIRELPSPATSRPEHYDTEMDGGKTAESGTTVVADEHHGAVRIGVVVADCSTGDVRVVEFLDDRHRSRLRTLMARFPPAEFCYPRKTPTSDGLTEFTRRMMRYDAPTAAHQVLALDEEFWEAERTAKELLMSTVLGTPLKAVSTDFAVSFKPSDVKTRMVDYFHVDIEAGEETTPAAVIAKAVAHGAAGPQDLIPLSGSDGALRLMPTALYDTIQRASSSGFSYSFAEGLTEEEATSSIAARDLEPSSLTLSAFGGLIFYLRRCIVDHSILSLRKIYLYRHADTATPVPGGLTAKLADAPAAQHMVMDGTTLLNLEILENSYDGSRKGTLVGILDTCLTPFGKRHFKQWLCAPLLAADDILRRRSAVEELMPLMDSTLADARRHMKGLPDLERLLARIHSVGSRVGARDLPDARAVFYEEALYSKRRIGDLLSVLKAFSAATKVKSVFTKGESAPVLRSQLLKTMFMERFPDLQPALDFFNTAFDAKQAEKDNKITPSKGVDKAYDDAIDEIKGVHDALDGYLEEQKSRLKCTSLSFWGTAKDRFQIEVPESLAPKVPSEYVLKSKRKGSGKTGGVCRYWTPAIENLLLKLVVAEDKRDAAIKDTLRRLFHRFDAHRRDWDAAVESLAILDCLSSLAMWSLKGDGGAMCAPTFGEGEPYLHIVGGRNPCMVTSSLASESASSSVIPNDLSIGPTSRGSPACILLTGPNMGGKSTLLRQSCIITILAQLGAYVPAERCDMTPVDRIFTRVGASDRILAGQSTFYVELAETSTILNQATRSSLVILDELGRGTSTFDGNAIAFAVTQYLTEVVQCRTMFATHYHTLCEDFERNDKVALGHMDCMVEEMPDGTSSVTFLYKYAAGACPKSYGLNVARLARLPESVILRAHEKSNEFEMAIEKGKGGIPDEISHNLAVLLDVSVSDEAKDAAADAVVRALLA